MNTRAYTQARQHVQAVGQANAGLATYSRAAESCPDGRRRVQASARECGLFTKGNRGHWDSGITQPSMNVDAQGRPLPKVRAARKPYADMPDAKVKIIRPATPTYCGRGCPIGTLAHAGECW